MRYWRLARIIIAAAEFSGTGPEPAQSSGTLPPCPCRHLLAPESTTPPLALGRGGVWRPSCLTLFPDLVRPFASSVLGRLDLLPSVVAQDRAWARLWASKRDSCQELILIKSDRKGLRQFLSGSPPSFAGATALLQPASRLFALTYSRQFQKCEARRPGTMDERMTWEYMIREFNVEDSDKILLVEDFLNEVGKMAGSSSA